MLLRVGMRLRGEENPLDWREEVEEETLGSQKQEAEAEETLGWQEQEAEEEVLDRRDEYW